MVKEAKFQDILIFNLFSGERLKMVDARPKSEYEKERIIRSVSLPLEEVHKDAAWFLQKDDMIVVYSGGNDCRESELVATRLAEMGYQNVFNYKGGLADYKLQDLPLEGSLYPYNKGLAHACSC